MAKTLFIAGTDTNVGKTIITAAIGAYFVEQGFRVKACKPFESGEPLNNDSRFLQAHIPLSQEVKDDINLYAFSEALAPGIAAERAKTSIDLNRAHYHIQTLQHACDILLIEGAGGLFVPIASTTHKHVMLIDWLATLRVPTLLVGRAGLGTLNHSLLSVNACSHQSIALVGVILNQTSANPGLADTDNATILQKNLDIPVWGPFSYLENLDRRALVTEASRLFKDTLYDRF